MDNVQELLAAVDEYLNITGRSPFQDDPECDCEICGACRRVTAAFAALRGASA